MVDYRDIEYLKTGNKIQRESREILRRLKIMEYLAEYTPILTGTIPIGIDVGGSDLDIICEVGDFKRFEEKTASKYAELEGYRLRRGEGYTVINFFSEGMEIEVYGTDKPTDEQNAYRHMIVEARLLSMGWEELRGEVIRLKENGIKTEPAFCMALGVEGDPYKNMLDEELMVEAFNKRFKDPLFS